MKIKRILMCVFGVVICGISVGMIKHASFGVDPFQSLMSGLNAVIPIRFGTLYMIANLVLLLFALIFDRRKIGLGTLINLFLLGYIVEDSQSCCRALLPEIGLAGRLALFAVGVVILCLSAAFYFTADLGVSTYDAVALIWSEKQSRLRFPLCRILCDSLCVLVGALLCAAGGEKLSQAVGAGTVVTAFFMGPLIAFFKQKAAIPFLYGAKAREAGADGAGPAGGGDRERSST